jgi:hypothetical protein
MASSADAIGRLIADQVLMASDRQLLQKRDQPGQQPKDQAAQATPAPISHNDKAMAAVLMTLLDEQLDASMADPKGLAGDPAAAQLRSAETGAAPNRIAAQYAEEAAVYRLDLPSQVNVNPMAQANQQVLLAASSPELRMAMQAALMAAAARVQAEEPETTTDNAQRRKIGSFASPSSAVRVGAGVFVVIVLAIILAARFAG